MGSVEAELWNIFTYYTLHGNVLDPEHLALTQMVQMARDTQMLDGVLMRTGLRKADIELVYIQEVKKRVGVTLGLQGMRVSDGGETTQVDKLTYNEFLTCLMKLSVKLYPAAAKTSLEIPFQQLLMENILPLASRRSPHSIDYALNDLSVQGIFSYFGESLNHIFEFYTSSGEAASKKKMGAKQVVKGRDFDATLSASQSRFANTNGGKGSGGKGRNGRRRSKGKSGPIKNDSLRDRYGKSSTSSPSSRKNVVAKKQQHSNKNNGRDTWQEADRSKRTSGGGGGGSKSNAMSRSDLKVAELTANFQQGTELQRLRNELEQSKASLNQSNQFIDHAKGWFKK